MGAEGVVTENLAEAFRDELFGLIDALEDGLVGLGEHGDDPEQLAEVFRAAHNLKSAAGVIGLEAAASLAHDIEAVLDEVREGTTVLDDPAIARLFGEVETLRRLVRIGSAAAEAQGPARPAADGDAAAQPRTLAVATRRVDALVDLTGELSIAASVLEQVRARYAGSADSRLEAACQEVRRLAGRLQEAATAIRLVPLSSTFAMLRRFVREKAPQLGKEVDVEVRGGDTEIDKAVGERLLDPLKHLVRNALDHGLEPAAQRRAAGKPARGRIALTARQERGAVVVTVEDDGSGFDLDRIRRAARARGLLGDAAELSDEAALDLVFLPGFTTAERVGELSGRGVGLDVVRRNVRDLGGEVRIENRPEHGSRVVLDVPLTLSVLEGLVLRCGEERLVVPIDVVRALVRPSSGQVRRLPHGAEILCLADGTVPLVRPGALFGAAGGDPGPEAVAVVVDVGGGPAALHADAVLAQEAVMLKSLQRNLRVGEGTLGAAVLSDGRVAVVVDVPRLVARAAESCATP